MTTKFPAEIDQFENPAPDTSQATARTHSQQHGDANDAVEAVQRKLGVDGSEDPGSIDYKVREIGGITDSLGTAAFQESSAFATKEQGELADTATQPAELNAATAQLQQQIDDALDQVFDGSPVYPDVATGIAAVTDGAQFKVRSSDPNVAYSVYQRVNAGNATLIADVPSASVMGEKADKSALAAKLDSPLFTSYSDAVSQALGSGSVDSLTNRLPTGVFGLQLGFANWSTAFEVGTDIQAGTYFDSVAAQVGISASASSLRLRLWSRPLANSGTSGAGPGSSGDNLLEERVYAAADIGLIPGQTAPTAVVMQINYRQAEAGVCYMVELDAIDAGGNRQTMSTRNTNVTGWPQRRRGYYRNSVTSNFWSNVGDSLALTMNLGRYKLISVPQLSSVVDANSTEIQGIGAAFDAVQKTAASKVPTADFGLSDDAGWAAMIKSGQDIEEGSTVSGLVIPRARLASGATHVVMNLRTRAADGTESLVPGADPSDSLVFSKSYSLTEVGTAGDGVARDMTFIFPVEHRVDSRNLIFDWIAYTASDEVAVSTQGYRAAGSDSAGRRGWYKTTPSAGFGPINSSFSVCWSLLSRSLVVKPEALPDYTDHWTADLVASAEFDVTDLSLDVRLRLLRGGAELAVTGVLSIAPASTGSVASESRTLAASLNNYLAFAYAPAVGRLSNANVSGVVVTRQSDGAVLSVGSDYQVNGPHGAVMRASAGADVPVNVAYNWANSRYSLVYVDANTLQIGVVDGAEKARFAAEFVPPIGVSSRIPLAYVRVVGGNMTVHPVWAVKDGYLHRDLFEQWEVDRRRNASAMRQTLGALRSGKPVVGIFYGDSIVAMQNAVPSTTVPNGVARDRATSSGGYISIPPITDAIPVYDFGDGAGPVHTKWGYARAMVAEMERAYGRQVTVQNLGLGGTRSDASATNGLDPARLAALTGLVQAAASAGSQAFVLINFGMNEVGVGTTEANVRQILDAVYSVGGDAIVAGVARRNLIDVGYTDDQWRYTNRALRRAAEYVSPETGRSAAFIETVGLFDDAFNVVGIHRLDNCGANFTNHPGIREHDAMARSASAWLD